ncbi:hypothetical protein EDB89DRAFT_1833444, partial [Lactarius sanguifluus]
NEAMVTRHCGNTGQRHYIVYALDSSENRPLTRAERIVIAHLRLEDTSRLPNKINLAVGMKAMVLENIAPNADLTNGSRGTISDIILDPREVLDDANTTTIRLQFPPAAVLFKPQSNKKTKLNGLPMGIVPIFPSNRKFHLGGETGFSVDRRQLPLTPAYTFSDYKSQGQMIESVLVDLTKPPTGYLTPFDAYVSLSRSRGRQTIRLLR